MEINRLNQEELIYELTIRGLSIGKVDEMRTYLRAALKAEKLGKSSIVDPYPIAVSDDLRALKEKVDEVNELLSEFSTEVGSTEYRKVVTKIEWAFGRLGRVQAMEEEHVKQKKEIRSSLILALGSLQLKAEGNDIESETSDSAEETICHNATVLTSRSRVPLYKWNITFSGEQGQSLNSFLERVSELAEARGVLKTQLFRSALDLFSGRALIWYRANRNKVQSWSDLVRELRKEFLPADYDDRFLEEIKRRTQGRDETIGTYVAVMTSMFSRLSIPLTEGQQLRILKRNISPFYQTQLGLADVDTVHDLVELGRRLEGIRSSVEAFAPPPPKRSSTLLEPDLAYAATEKPEISVLVEPHNNVRRSIKCFKCGREGHIARFCRVGIKCFGCGSPGVIRQKCNYCRDNPPLRVNSSRTNDVSYSNEQRTGNESRARQ